MSPEIARDFFWDDEFRAKWDDMLAHSAIIDECPTTGTMLVQWIRKVSLPFLLPNSQYDLVSCSHLLASSTLCFAVPLFSVVTENT